MNQNKLLVGIDGGGSKTTALLADERQVILGRGTSGPSNYQSVGLTAALTALDAAVSKAIGSSHALPVSAVGMGIAGVARPEDRGAFLAWAEERFPGAQVYLGTDAQIVLAAGTGEGWGLAIISGTGSIVYGQNAAGEAARAGGWGYLLGDEGSGYRIGLAGLQAVTRSQDRVGRPTLLTGRLLAYLGLHAPEDLIGYIYRPERTRGEIARLAVEVESCALAGDEAAGQIIEQAASDLAAQALSVAGKLGLTLSAPCAMAGGLLVNSALLREKVIEQARQQGLRLEPVVVVEEPARGALRLAAALV